MKNSQSNEPTYKVQEQLEIDPRAYSRYVEPSLLIRAEVEHSPEQKLATLRLYGLYSTERKQWSVMAHIGTSAAPVGRMWCPVGTNRNDVLAITLQWLRASGLTRVGSVVDNTFDAPWRTLSYAVLVQEKATN